MRLQDFNSFIGINEDFDVTLFRGTDEIFKTVTKDYKNRHGSRSLPKAKDKISFRMDNQDYDSFDGFDSKMGNFLIYSLYHRHYTEKSKDYYKHQIFLFASPDRIDNFKELDDIFPPKGKGTYGSDNFKITRTIVKDSTKTKFSFDLVKDYDEYNRREYEGTSGNRKWFVKEDMYFVAVRYDYEKTDSMKFEVKDVMKLPEYREITDMGWILSSTEKQVENGTLTWSYLTSDIYVPPTQEMSWSFKHFYSDDQKFLDDAFTMTSTGYIRKIFNWSGQPAAVKGKFQSTSLEGWSEGMKTVIKFMKKWRKDLEDRSYVLLDTPELKHQYRGRVAAKKFGF